MTNKTACQNYESLEKNPGLCFVTPTNMTMNKGLLHKIMNSGNWEKDKKFRQRQPARLLRTDENGLQSTAGIVIGGKLIGGGQDTRKLENKRQDEKNFQVWNRSEKPRPRTPNSNTSQQGTTRLNEIEKGKTRED